ncbi:hypothetical protein HYPDE_36963 [Hyphomicrobium denitrificans 1NES1]|uniref:DUF1772 domain-containing protein n=1 Tax=Hyphomicrobium denitrificans 1NES1 TaxID=670307 RepID=N0B674_9HYPH|nr:hypothetical protein [Hyphomicrobium denitrificans]AGK59064.1 hypothetical protein HYPDE_36963 [Hyphomicrobium denitrificans 1NES1]
MSRVSGYRIALAIALLSTAIALGGALAHLFELPNKIALSRDDYFVVQGIYRGWDLLGFVLLVQLLSIVTVIVLSKPKRDVRLLSVIALICLVAALFWTFTYPANVATDNWTTIPANWEALRRSWEYSHAAGAIFQLTSMTALIGAAIA